MSQIHREGRGILDRLREVQINPAVVVVAAILLAGGLVYGLWLRPAQEADRIKREWITPEAAKARSPEGRPSNPDHEKFIESLRRKEHGGGVATPASQR